MSRMTARTATWSSNWIVEVVISTGITVPSLVRCRPSQLSTPVAELPLEPLLEARGELGPSIWSVVIPSSSSRRVAELAAGRGIGVEDPALLVVDEDRVLDPVEECPGAALRLDHRLLGTGPLADVGDERIQPQRLARFVAEDVDHQLDGDQRPILCAGSS